MKVYSSTIEQLEKDKSRGRCRKWRIWLNTDEGRKSERFSGTYSQALERQKALISEYEQLVPNSETFAAYSASWALWREKSGNFEKGTLSNDKRNVAALVRSPLGAMRMDEITPEKCRDALMWVKSHPVSIQGELSNTSMNKIHIALKAIMQQAEDDGKIAKNPMARIKAPKTDTKEKEALSPDELMLLLNRIDETLVLDGRTMAVYFMACLGLRRGEACALNDGDIRNGFAYIHASVKDRDGSIGEPKTKSGVRTLPIPERLAKKIEEWRVERVRLGWRDSETLCCNTEGGILRPQLLQRWWSGDAKHKGASAKLGCEGMTLHQLRHSNLSMMARHMSPFDLQRYAGWSSIEPAKVYIHDDLEAVSRAVVDAWSVNGCTKFAPEAKAGQNTRL